MTLPDYNKALIIDKIVTPKLDNIEFNNNQNCINKRRPRKNKSGYENIGFSKIRRSWLVYYSIDGVRKRKQFKLKPRKDGTDNSLKEAVDFQCKISPGLAILNILIDINNQKKKEAKELNK